MSRESSLQLAPRGDKSLKRLDSPRWRGIFQILTVVGMFLVLISLLLLLQRLGAGDVPPATIRL